MKRMLLFVCIAMATATATSSSYATAKPVPATVRPLDGTIVGYQTDSLYYYTFVADLSGAQPFTVTSIIVSRLSDGATLTTLSESAKVFVRIQTVIDGTATVTFVDGSTTITKTLTGGLAGGILPSFTK
jgi:hypothetical protein